MELFTPSSFSVPPDFLVKCQAVAELIDEDKGSYEAVKARYPDDWEQVLYYLTLRGLMKWDYDEVWDVTDLLHIAARARVFELEAESERRREKMIRRDNIGAYVAVVTAVAALLLSIWQAWPR